MVNLAYLRRTVFNKQVRQKYSEAVKHENTVRIDYICRKWEDAYYIWAGDHCNLKYRKGWYYFRGQPMHEREVITATNRMMAAVHEQDMNVGEVMDEEIETMLRSLKNARKTISDEKTKCNLGGFPGIVDRFDALTEATERVVGKNKEMRAALFSGYLSGIGAMFTILGEVKKLELPEERKVCLESIMAELDICYMELSMETLKMLQQDMDDM